jgi:hypothetical protein
VLRNTDHVSGDVDISDQGASSAIPHVQIIRRLIFRILVPVFRIQLISSRRLWSCLRACKLTTCKMEFFVCRINDFTIPAKFCPASTLTPIHQLSPVEKRWEFHGLTSFYFAKCVLAILVLLHSSHTATLGTAFRCFQDRFETFAVNLFKALILLTCFHLVVECFAIKAVAC